MAENNALQVMDVASAMSASGTGAYCSLKSGTAREKAQLFNAMSNPNHKVGDYINKVIRVRDVFVEAIELENEDTGDMIQVPRIVLIDMDGDSYQAVSKGVFNSLARLIKTFGEPTWEDGIPLLVRQISIGKNQMLSLEVDVDSI